MVLQNVILPGKMNINPEIYFRSSEKMVTTRGMVVIPQGVTLRTDTYMNTFDVGTWKKYTTISGIRLRIKIDGVGTAKVWSENAGQTPQLWFQKRFDIEGVIREDEELVFDIPYELEISNIFFEIDAETECILKYARFETLTPVPRDVRIAIAICTYKRREQLEQLLEELKMLPELGVRFNIKVVDNASELPDHYGKGIQLYHNPNTGGSGGFSRGMDETIKDLKQFAATHLVLMDDDVIIQTESLLRLYALLSFVRDGYEGEVVAGRMFRMDNPEVQYTACEIWNAGDIKHIGWNQDMTIRERLFDMNKNAGGEYSGWWFACFPIEFVKENRPLPFFLHCDDVEYGLRHGGEPIVLNGIQVWHETYEYRQSPVIEYYDYRNSLIVNEKYGLIPNKDMVLEEWKEKISEYHVLSEYTKECLIILGLLDFCLYYGKLYKCDGAKYHRRLCGVKGNRIRNAFLWRYVKIIFKRRFK